MQYDHCCTILTLHLCNAVCSLVLDHYGVLLTTLTVCQLPLILVISVWEASLTQSEHDLPVLQKARDRGFEA